VDDEQLSEFMLYLQDNGCHNINFVTPSHVIPQIISALEIAVPKGLEIPIIYNSSGYDSLESLKLLEGLIDIYMPDFKFWNPDIAKRTCETPDYPSVARRAIMEMYRQVGDLLIGENGIAKRGLLVRHLVMPENYSGTEDIMKFIADKVSVNTYVNIMSQYRPSGMAHSVTEINRKIKDAEFTEALNAATNNGITLIDC
jgi:putative pyruvate formate lyase activating enzyme